MIASAMPDVDRVGVQVKNAARVLPAGLVQGRVRLWVNAFRMYRRFAATRRSLRRLRRSISRDAVFQAPDGVELLSGIAQSMGEILLALRSMAADVGAADRPPVYRPAARQLDALCDEAEDLQETAALASSPRFREFVERELETA